MNVTQSKLFLFVTEMAESPTEIIRRTITTVLPDFSEELVHSLIDALKEVGVETLDDMRYVTEGDLVPTLNPIQARRLVTWAKNGKNAIELS